MLEQDFQRRLLKRLREHPALTRAVIFKHSDMWNAGIPDMSISLNGVTTWFELKLSPNKPTKLQAHFLEKLKPRSMVVTAVATGEVYCGPIYCRDLESTVDLIIEACKMEKKL